MPHVDSRISHYKGSEWRQRKGKKEEAHLLQGRLTQPSVTPQGTVRKGQRQVAQADRLKTNKATQLYKPEGKGTEEGGGHSTKGRRDGTKRGSRASLYSPGGWLLPDLALFHTAIDGGDRRIAGRAHSASCIFVGPHLRPDAEATMNQRCAYHSACGALSP